MKRPPEPNKVTPDYFYERVAKKVGLPRALVKDIYEKYLTRVTEMCKIDTKINMIGLGSITVDTRKHLHRLHSFNRLYARDPSLFDSDEVQEWLYRYIKNTSKVIKNLIIVTDQKYDYLKRYLEDTRADSTGIKELFDNEGNCRRDFRIKDKNMQELSIQLGECEDVGGIQEYEGEALLFSEE